MDKPLHLQQHPEPGKKLKKFCGDTVTFELTLKKSSKGKAWVRTNIGHADITRKEIIRDVEFDETPLKKDWFDIPMKQVENLCHRLTLPLVEVGHFEAKCLFIEADTLDPVWPDGENTVVNVQPADTCCANIIYNAFVRQFGKSKNHIPINPSEKERIHTLDKEGYTVIPPSGTFRDLICELDFIMGELGCRILQLLPIHPTPTTFARMGRFGSPYAALDFTAVDTALVEFDPKATPLEQFIELVDAVHQRNGKILMDIAVNHTGWGAEIHETHPEWLVRDADGRIINPGAWGITWEDLTKLDYSHKDLWLYISDIFLTWCKRGVDGFRCDAGYMIPVSTWTYIIAKVRTQFPDTLFFLEGLGGKISVCRDLLNLANFNWAYSELFQNYDRQQIEHYLPGAIEISTEDGTLVHFAETHDNQRLAAKSTAYAKLRTAFCAMSAINGAFGFANGVEWLATEKIVVHESPSLNWGAANNLVDHLRRLNILLRQHPAFHDDTQQKMIQIGDGNHIAIVRSHEPSGKKLLVLANLDDKSPVHCKWQTEIGFEDKNLIDLISGGKFTIQHEKDHHGCWLEAGQVLCLTPAPSDLALIRTQKHSLSHMPQRIEYQRYKQKALEILCYFEPLPNLETINIDDEVDALTKNPECYIQGINRKYHPQSQEPKVVYWDWPQDANRFVMVPSEHFLMIRSDSPFMARIESTNDILYKENCYTAKSGFHFAVFLPCSNGDKFLKCELKISVFTKEGPRHSVGHVFFLPNPHEISFIQKYFSRSLIHTQTLMTLQTNGGGGMLRTSLSWPKLTSRYDALLAANLNPNHPEDRRILFARCRAWVVFQGYSYEINEICLENFALDDNGYGHWQFHVPVGRGRHIELTLTAKMEQNKNCVHLIFKRHTLNDITERLEDEKPVRLILRPDIEDRSFHDTTKAYTGPEKEWPDAVSTFKNGFHFFPSPDRHLKIAVSNGDYMPEPEWYYMIYHPVEAQRGLDPDSDLFSPGYFSSLLKGGESLELTATAAIHPEEEIIFSAPDMSDTEVLNKSSILHGLEYAMTQFVVKRDDFRTVIAGYPWFLDWGRDTLIFTRGLIASKQYDQVKSILQQFGKFESKGTLPNMIRGENADNRDTSDAPLWFCVSCADLMAEEGSMDFLKASCGDRTIRQVLLSIGKAYSKKTPNGISMDPASGLIFSPSHFTWMDTNHPAGTPRQGYPIEIQALWYKTVELLSTIDTKKNADQWKTLATKIQESILRLFCPNGMDYLSDCLHATPGKSAESAQPDDALRPNQLLAITLGAVSDDTMQKNILTACQSLLVPGAIRSLADKETKHPLAVYHDDKLLNNPNRPYQGYYGGDEDTQRKPAYHNGTAWTWMFPSYSEAYAMVYGDSAKTTALSILTSSLEIINSGCVCQVPEILDGNYPHTQRGCDAQAWGVSELYRVWKKLL